MNKIPYFPSMILLFWQNGSIYSSNVRHFYHQSMPADKRINATCVGLIAQFTRVFFLEQTLYV